MRRFRIFITRLSLIERIGRHPSTASFLMLLDNGAASSRLKRPNLALFGQAFLRVWKTADITDRDGYS
jgi:hypothetical protein